MKYEPKEEGKLPKDESLESYEGNKPIRLIRNSIKEITISQELRNQILDTAIGLSIGYISKRIFEGMTSGPLKRLIGTALMFAITKVVTSHPEVVNAWAGKLVEIIRGKSMNKNISSGHNESG